ncbi:YdcF family protein [Falsiroseomonas sp. HC035]|uniref:YdcF family protein n=1 Tax=Falsiroseomonas sp. HC035 TaxID=3390999 RepID=UPI003D31CE9D
MNGLQAILGAVLLPPIGLLVLGLLAGLVAWRRSRTGRRSRAGLLAALAAAAVILLATPLVAGLLMAGLQVTPAAEADAPPGVGPGSIPGAIIILGGDIERGRDGREVGPLTLERLRAGAALHRTSGLPILVTGGSSRPDEPSLAALMARSLRTDFGVPVRWVEAEAADTRQNADLSAALLRADGIDAALLVSQAWHLPRAMQAFARQGFAVRPAPVRHPVAGPFEPQALVPRADHLAESWFAIHEWAGRAFYALRDGVAPS